MIVFEAVAKPLLFLHWLAAIATIGAAAHLAVRAFRMRRSSVSSALLRLHTRLLLISYSTCWLLGAVVYPTFRVRVRHALFDRELPWVTGLFEAKEHLASLGLVAVIGLLFLMPHVPGESEEDRRAGPLFGALLGLVLAILIYSGWTGWYLSTLKAV